MNDNRYVEKPYTSRYYTPPIGAAVMVGGGLQDFSLSNARNMTDPGGYWSARMIFGTRNFVGLEAAYVGSAQSINALGLSNDAVLVSNGAEGALRLNIPITMRRASLFEPFGFVGAGWTRFHVARSSTANSDVASNDDVMTVPYGGGVAFAYSGFMADARFTYRSTFYNDLLRTSGGRLDTWQAGGQLGFEF
jgi:hypothetical protein